ncbi:hypothetical protein MKW98_006228 [Papaver atlanticum]|uniref:PGG domain-containing protein n=1 Tax=Papaver atlanticum TaxID=357466 RepID=A0AAD4XXE1_9MAGN|nr:hypothetical protein MKW98_006228 [Papaver atlanticum]
MLNQEDDGYIWNGYEELWEAAANGDWETAKEFLNTYPAALTEPITVYGETALHIAAYESQVMFVQEIVNVMPEESLALQGNRRGFTALHIAAKVGDVRTAAVMVRKNRNLTQIRDKKGRVPLQIAAKHASDGQKEVLEYLISETRDEDPSPFSGHGGAGLLRNILYANFYDMALSLVQRFPKLVTEKTKITQLCGLEVMIQRPFVFLSGAKLAWWQRCIYSLIQVDMGSTFNHGTTGDEENLLGSSSKPSSSCEGTMTKFISMYLMPYLTRVTRIKKLYNQKLMHRQALSLVKYMLAQLDKTMSRFEISEFFDNSCAMKTAITYGTVECVVECLRKFPYLILEDFGNKTMIEMAIEERNERILSVIFETCPDDAKNELVSSIDESNNGILHYAAKLAPSSQLSSISGAALQMQREIQWFKGVENIVPEKDKYLRNKDGNTAQFIFTEKHKDLMEKGEKWMKDTSGSCMLVAALIATVAFAASITVPGGSISDTNSRNNGIPIFLEKNSFTVFAVADALALFSAITSVLMFLAIYTSRYGEKDFLKSLPQKLIIGLASLFISMATIMVAFGAALTIVIGHRFTWAPIPIALFGSIPVILFVFLQLPLFIDMVKSTYWPGIFGKHSIRVMKRNKNKKEKKN